LLGHERIRHVRPMSDDGQWLTYSQIAALRGIDRRSAERLVRRRGWRRQPDNAGFVRALVPADVLTPDIGPDGDRTTPDTSRDAGPDVHAFAVAIATIEATVTIIRGELSRANDRADKAELRAEAAEKQVAELIDRMEGLGTRLAAAQAALATAEAAAEALRRADEARRSARLLARLRAAWRGE
jgi:hypothetical protein